jgi:hypothetical protein
MGLNETWYNCATTYKKNFRSSKASAQNWDTLYGMAVPEDPVHGNYKKNMPVTNDPGGSVVQKN